MNRKSTFLVSFLASAVSLGSLAWAQTVPSNVTNTVALDKLSKVLEARSVADRAKAEKLAKEKGFPIRKILPNGKIISLQRLNARGKPVYYQTDNVDAADTISTDEIQVGGSTGLDLTGGGMKIGEWDGGNVRATHNELSGRITNFDAATISDHSTHVAGTMIASGAVAAAQGMATAATIDAYDFDDDNAEMAAAAADLLLSNHSYGTINGWEYNLLANDVWAWFGDLTINTAEDFLFGFYDSGAQAWDQIAFDAPYYLIVKSAGNDRNDPGAGAGGFHYHWDNGSNSWVSATDTHNTDCAPSGYDCIATAGTAKNILTVGAVEDIVGGYQLPANVVMSSFSGWGPTDDGRIKPDVVANGVNLYSSLGSRNNIYGTYSGTSMSAPNTTGSLILLQEHYQDTHAGSLMRSATLKALVIHTADEAGTADGPDYEYGWGLVNTESAAEVITEDGGAHRIIEDMLSNGGTYSTQINVNEPDAVVKATLVWTDPPGTPPSDSLDPTDKMLLNDLDLRVYDSSGTYMPWVLDPVNPANAATTGDNDTDNVEHVWINGGTPGAYFIEITHKGTLLNTTAQNFSLIISVESRETETTLVDEDFSGGLPTGWSVIDNISGTSAVWRFDNPGSRTNLTGGTDEFAIVDSDNAGSSSTTDSELRTASVDLSAYTTVTLSFKSDFYYFSTAPDEIADVDVSTNGGTVWTNVWQRTGGSERGPTSHVVDLTSIAAGQSDVIVRFHYYNAGWDWWWQVDDVQIVGNTLTAEVCGNEYNLPANQWRLISLPCDPGSANSVSDLFSDDFTGGDSNYNTTWALFERDEANDRYVRLTTGSPLVQGRGYWIFSTEDTLLDMTGTATPLVTNTDCSSSTNKCFEMPLIKPVAPGGSVYNMLGHPQPYPVNWANARITAVGDAASPFTPSGADSSPYFYFSKNVYTYTGNSYAVYDDITPGYEEGALGAWDGFFVEVLDNSQSTGDMTLLMPPERSVGVITTALIDALEPSMAIASKKPGLENWLALLNILVNDTNANVARQWKKKFPGLEKRRAHRKKHHDGIKAQKEWFVRLIVDVEAEGLRDEGNVLGQLNDSVIGLDHHDLKELPPNAPYLTVLFPHPDWEADIGNFTSDFHPAGQNRNDSWSFEVRTDDPSRLVKLSWEGEKRILRRSRLIDEKTGKVIKPGKAGEYEFVIGDVSRTFTWEFGGRFKRR